MTTANKITILRIVLIPFFVVETVAYEQSGNHLPWLLALGSFALAALLDGVDGYVARRFRQISELGTKLDPLADKLLLVSAIIVLSCDRGERLGRMPLWLTGVILGRDALLVLGALVIHHFVGHVRVRPRWTGKAATVFQMLAVLWLLLHANTGPAAPWFLLCAALAAICTAVSGVLYVWDGMRQLSAHPSSAPKPNDQQHPMAKAIELKLNVGDPAPAFTAATNGSGHVSLADYLGKHVILYFYPKDDTPGCTKEACAFRDHFADFKKRGAVILGVSTDPVKSHDKFVEKFKLPFTLLADEDKAIVQAYGVWGKKSFMGREYMGTNRVTFLIGPDGKIARIWPTVKPEEHAEEVLAALG